MIDNGPDVALKSFTNWKEVSKAAGAVGAGLLMDIGVHSRPDGARHRSRSRVAREMGISESTWAASGAHKGSV